MFGHQVTWRRLFRGPRPKLTERRPRAAICGLAGTALGEDERALFGEMPPAGFILFQRNCVNRGQLKKLTDELRALFPERWVPILIDQEGGRVQRLKPPIWPQWPSARALGLLAEQDMGSGLAAARLHAQLLSAELRLCGIDVSCAPVLDLLLPETTAAIGDRAFSGDPDICAKLGRAAIAGYRQAGVVPVIKHLPGHGRARVDSHLELPRIQVSLDMWRHSDAIPFIANANVPMAMTCHLLFEAIDPDRPATMSPRIINDIIRGEIGFTGILISDDLSMSALDGSIEDRAASALAAGCDLALHCNGKLEEMVAVLEAMPLFPVRRLAQLQALEPTTAEPLSAELADLESMLAHV